MRDREARVEVDDDCGGDPPCWAHLFEEPDAGTDEAPEPGEGGATSHAVVVDLATVAGTGPGVVWSLPHGGDLDANLVRLPAGGAIGEHVNDALDVLLHVRAGHGSLVVDGRGHALRPDVVVLVPRGARRAVTAGPEGLAYLSIHRRRPPLTVGRR